MKRTSLAIAAGAFVVALCAAGWRPLADWWQLRTSTQQLAQSYGEYRVADYRIAASPHAAVRLERSAVRRSTFDLPASLAAAESRIAARLAEAPDDPRWLNLRGQADLMRGHHDEAIDALEHALDYQPGAPALRRDLGMAFAMRAAANPKRAIDYLFAIENLGQSLRKNPADNVTRFNYALALEQMFLYTDALNAWKEYLAAEPGGAWAEEARACQRRVAEKVAVRERALKLVVEEPAEYLRLEREGKALAPEFYFQAALRGWMKEDSPAHREALHKLAERMIETHQDPWLRDILPALNTRATREALRSLAGATTASETGKSAEALVRLGAARAVLAARGQRAAALWADREEVVALQYAVRPRECAVAAERLERAAERYPWPAAEAMVQQYVCRGRAGMNGGPAALLRGVARTQRFALPRLGFRATSYAATFQRGYRSRTWNALVGYLASYWQTAHGYQYGQTVYVEFAAIARRERCPLARMLLLQQAAEQISRSTVTEHTAFALQLAADAAFEAGFPRNAEVLLSRGRRISGSALYPALGRLVREEGRDEDLALLASSLPDLPPSQQANYHVARARRALRRGEKNDAGKALALARSLFEVSVRANQSASARAGLVDIARSAYELSLSADTPARAFEAWQNYLRLTDGLPSLENGPSLRWRVDKETLLTFVESHSRLSVFVLDAHGLSVVTVPTPAAEISSICRALERLVTNPESALRDVDRAANVLYDALLRPVEDHLAGSGPLVIQTDGAAALVPWSLVGNLRRLKHRPLLLAQSLGPSTIRRTVPGDWLIVRNPSTNTPLPAISADQEVSAIRRHSTALTLLEGETATGAQFLGAMRRAAVLHFAGHGIAAAGAGALILAPDQHRPAGLLDAEGIAECQWPALELAVLASCESGVGESGRRVDPGTLVRSILRAGAGRVIASRWRVPSDVTSRLLARFYDELKKTRDVSLALSLAQESIRSQPGSKHPYSWAGFQAYGSPARLLPEYLIQ